MAGVGFEETEDTSELTVGFLETVVEKIHARLGLSCYKSMSRERTERAKYQLRSVPRQDYGRQLKGTPISREAVYAAATRETTQKEEGVVAGMDQLLQLMAEQLRQQQEERQQEKEYRRK